MAELEDHLREQVSVLMGAGPAAVEPFLVAVKRMGELDALSREFAREHSERLWKQLVVSPESGETAAEARTDAFVAVALAVAAAVLVKLPGWNYRMTEMQSAIGLAELERMDSWNLPTRRRNAYILINALRELPQIRFCPVDTEERRNGWYVLAFSLNIESMNCTIHEFVDA